MKRPVLIIGATGVIGREVVSAAVGASVPVIAVARDPGKLQALKSGFPKADIEIHANAISSDEEGIGLARMLLDSDRPLAGVVAAINGSTGRGRLLDQPVSDVRNEVDEVLLPHLSSARHLLPVLAGQSRTGNYILIGGPGGESPWAGYGPRSVIAAAMLMVARVLHDEARALGVRVQLLAVDAPACTDENSTQACPRWPKAALIGKRAFELATQCNTPLRTHPIVPLQIHAYTLPPNSTGRRDRASAAINQDLVPNSDYDERRSLDDARRLLGPLIDTNNNEVSR